MKTKIWANFYFAVVGIFSIVYYGFWLFEPDSFIVNSELNIFPFSEFRSFLWGDGVHSYKTIDIRKLDDLKREYDKAYLAYVETQSKIDAIELEMKKIEEKERVLSEKRDSEVGDNIESYKAKEMAPLIEKESMLKRELIVLEGKIPKNISSESDIDLIREAGLKKVELAQHRVVMANKAYRNSEFVFSNLLLFMSQETRDEFYRLRESSAKNHQVSFKLEDELRKIRSDALDQVRDHIQAARERIDFFDFLYFSVGISTTTTFGDMVANDKTVRGCS